MTVSLRRPDHRWWLVEPCATTSDIMSLGISIAILQGRQADAWRPFFFAHPKARRRKLATTTVSEVSALHIRQADKTNPVGSWG